MSGTQEKLLFFVFGKNLRKIALQPLQPLQPMQKSWSTSKPLSPPREASFYDSSAIEDYFASSPLPTAPSTSTVTASAASPSRPQARRKSKTPRPASRPHA